jgi:hypothetical protein
MTVRREGEGDRGGDRIVAGDGDLRHADSAGASEGVSVGDGYSVGHPVAGIGHIGGKFWALLEEDVRVEAATPEVAMSTSTYLQPSPASSEINLQGSSRGEKRMQKRFNQRRAAWELDPSSIEVHVKLSLVSSPRRRQKLPVLEPSVFWLDSIDAAEWIRVHKRKTKQLNPRRITAPNRLTAIARERRRRVPVVPDR